LPLCLTLLSPNFYNGASTPERLVGREGRDQQRTVKMESACPTDAHRESAVWRGCLSVRANSDSENQSSEIQT
jgi:hypothetical protein